MRKRIYEIICKSEDGDKASAIYDIVMIVLIVLSLIPLAFKQETETFAIIDKVTVTAFIIDYILRLITADFFFEKAEASSFLKYPFTPMAIIDLLSILPSIAPVNSGLKVLRVLRMMRAIRVVRVFKAFRYSSNMAIIVEVIRRSKDSLYAVCALAVGYILVAALIIFNVEPDSFKNFFEAIYWAAVSLTTVGYGDVYATSTTGRVITIVSAFIGIAIVALPSGILTAGFMEILQEKKDKGAEK